MPLFALAMAGGALSGALASPHLVVVVLAAVVCAAAVLCALVFRRLRGMALALAAIAALALGTALAQARVAAVSRIDVPLNGSSRILCEGRVLHPPIERAWGVEVDVRLISCIPGPSPTMTQAQGMVRLQATKEAGDLLPGERIRFRARFFTAREYKNPGSFSYREYLRVHGIGAMARAYGALERMGGGGRVMARIETIRRRVAASIAARIDPPERGIVTALAIGDQGGIDPEVRQSFADTGLAHILAISGMNVGYVALFLYALSRLIFGRSAWLLRRVPVRILSAVVTLPAIWGYILLTGTLISAVRAGIMLTVFLIGVLLWRRQDLLSTLAVAVVIVLIVLPLSILDVSFQLSVAAVMGIVVIAPRMVAWWDRSIGREGLLRRGLHWLWALVSVTVSATLATLPIVAYHFKFVTGIGVLANLGAVPLSGALLSPLVAVATALTIAAPALAAPLWGLSGHMAGLLIRFARLSAEVGAPLVVRWSPSVAEAALLAAAIAAVVFWRRLSYRRAAIALLATAAVIDAGAFRVLPMLTGDLEITIIDVGQGDSALVRFPRGRTLLIDGGGIKGSTFDVGKNIVAPALWRMGIHRVDWLLLTHPHYDHYRGLGYIAGQFQPELVWTNGREAPESEGDDWGAFKRQLAAAGVPLVPVGDEGIAMEIGGASLRIIPPPASEGWEFNDTSLVADVRHGAHRFLFVGDLTQEGERGLVKGEGDLRADVLKVGHHGSADASSELFLNAVRPSVAAISLGEHNRYGMPAAQTLARIERAGARVYRTDLDGAITIASDGEDLEVETFVRR